MLITHTHAISTPVKPLEGLAQPQLSGKQYERWGAGTRLNYSAHFYTPIWLWATWGRETLQSLSVMHVTWKQEVLWYSNSREVKGGHSTFKRHSDTVQKGTLAFWVYDLQASSLL